MAAEHLIKLIDDFIDDKYERTYEEFKVLEYAIRNGLSTISKDNEAIAAKEFFTHKSFTVLINKYRHLIKQSILERKNEARTSH